METNLSALGEDGEVTMTSAHEEEDAVTDINPGSKEATPKPKRTYNTSGLKKRKRKYTRNKKLDQKYCYKDNMTTWVQPEQ